MSPALPSPWRRARLALIAGAALLCGSLLALAAAPRPDAQPRPVTPRGALTAEERQHVDVFKAISPSVVHITTLEVGRELFSTDVPQIPRGTGTGFMWDERGHIVTNFHVIQGGNAARVTLADQSSYPAELVGAFPDRDLAVLRIDAPRAKLAPIPIGRSRDLLVGQQVYAIGNPFGLDQTLTRGIVSALNREIESVTRRLIRGAIQTDAAINPGNSGGPLLDSAGRLIGVNTAIYSPSGASAGIGFAVPIDTINRVAPALIATGRYSPPSLGQVAHADTPVTFTIVYEYTIHARVYPVEDGGTRTPGSNKAELKQWMGEEAHVQYTPEMRKLYRQIAGKEKDPSRLARLFYNWISANVRYSYAREYSTLDDIGLYCGARLAGDCGQEALLYITLCRMAGIPARWQSGWTTFPDWTGLHDWTEIYLEPHGWIPVDPYMGIWAEHYMDQLTPDERVLVRDFYFGSMDACRLPANAAHSAPFDPPKQGWRSDDVDSQRGELEWADGTNIYFDAFDYDLDVKPIEGKSGTRLRSPE